MLPPDISQFLDDELDRALIHARSYNLSEEMVAERVRILMQGSYHVANNRLKSKQEQARAA